MESAPLLEGRPSAIEIALGSSVASVIGASSTQPILSCSASRRARAAASATIVLPMPPAPTTLTSRALGEQALERGKFVLAPEQHGRR